ncbi:RNA polymerase sigma factor [Parasphingorhabdus sp.]
MKKTSHNSAPDPRLTNSFSEYAPRLKRFLAARLGNEIDAQDLAQEAYFRLCRVAQPDLIREPDAYLFRIASNLANEFLLKKNKQPFTVDIDTVGESLAEIDGMSFSDKLEQRAEIAELAKILDQLPPLYQAILLLRKRDGYSHREIAEKLNISHHTVHKYLKRALLRCRTLWVELET